MKRVILFVLLLGTSLLFLNFSTGCQNLPTNGSKSQFKTVEVKHFTQSDNLGLSQDFVNSFYYGFREQLKKAQVADQVVDEGATLPDADTANSVVVEGKFTEYSKGGYKVLGVVGSEIKLYRKSDHTLITAITPRVQYKRVRLTTDKTRGRYTGAMTADEIKKALK